MPAPTEAALSALRTAAGPFPGWLHLCLLFLLAFALPGGSRAIQAAERFPDRPAARLQELRQSSAVLPPYRQLPAFVNLDLPSPPRPLSVSARRSQTFLYEARTLALAGKDAAALELLARGLELAPGNPDLLHAQAWLLYRANGKVREALAALQAVEQSTDWYFTRRMDAMVFRCRLLHLMGKTWELDQFLSSGVFGERDPDRLFWQARLAASPAGLTEDHAALATGLRLYPDDPRFMNIKLGNEDGLDFSDAQWFRRHAGSSPDYLSALAWRIRRLEPSEEQAGAIGEYLAKAGQDPWVSAWALANLLSGLSPGQGLDESALVAQLLGAGKALDLDVTMFTLRLLNQHGRSSELLKTGLKGQRVMYRDLARDGFPEERVVLQDGLPLYWARDMDQDGRDEFVLLFDAGVPSWLVRSDGQAETAVRYSVYPELSHAMVTAPGSTMLYYLHERRLEARVVDIPEDGWTDPLALLSGLQLPRVPVFPEQDDLAAEAWLGVHQEALSGNPALTTTSWQRFDQGQLFAAACDSDADGQPDVIELYAQGVLAFRALSTAEPGVFERLVRFDGTRSVKEYFFSPSDKLRFQADSRTGLSVWDANRDRFLDFGELEKAVQDACQYFREYL